MTGLGEGQYLAFPLWWDCHDSLLLLLQVLFFSFQINQVITSAEAVEYILKTAFGNFVKGPRFFDNFEEFLGRGIFAVDGEEWKTQRKIASHLFKTKNLKTAMAEVGLLAKLEGSNWFLPFDYCESPSSRMARRLLRS